MNIPRDYLHRVCVGAVVCFTVNKIGPTFSPLIPDHRLKHLMLWATIRCKNGL